MSDPFSVQGRIVCVTGASSGIGRFLASTLVSAGASVVGVARRKDQLDAWAEEAGAAGGQAATVSGDLSTPEGLEGIAVAVKGPFGDPEILVNAAGVNPRAAADDLTLEVWRATIDLNLTTPFFLARCLVPAMKARAWGRIINIASMQSFRAMSNGLAYGASKGGIVQLTRAMAEAWSRDGITCNALGPGFFPTELTEKVYRDAALLKQLAGQTCIGRNGELNDLVGPALFLASPASDYVTGQVLCVDGGFTAK